MGYGLGVFLLALGLILAFAVRDMIDAVDLTMVGYILCLAGRARHGAHRRAAQRPSPHLDDGHHHRRPRTAGDHRAPLRVGPAAPGGLTTQRDEGPAEIGGAFAS